MPWKALYDNVTLYEGWNAILSEWDGTSYKTVAIGIDSDARWVFWEK